MLTKKSATVLEEIARGHSYERIVRSHPSLTYCDIFLAAREALNLVGEARARGQRRRRAIHAQHARAYDKWTGDEEAQLKRLVRSGTPQKTIAALLQRQPSAIRSRMVKLGLVEDGAESADEA